MLSQEVDAVIEEEKLGNDSAFEEHEDKNNGAEDDNANGGDSNQVKSSDDGDSEDKPGDEGESKTAEVDKKGDEKQDEADGKTEEEPAKTDDVEKGPSATEQVEQAKSLIGQLQLTEDKIFDDRGNAKPFEEVVPPGAYLAAQLSPVKVTDKDGKQHEFLLISDVEKAFPDGFEAKNNIEQMKFERAIVANENKFEEALKTYNSAKQTYGDEVGQLVRSRDNNAAIRNEYFAMADKGLVPQFDASNPQSSANKAALEELDKLLTFRDTKNAELKKQGLGGITSLWVAKQLMDGESKKVETEDKKTKVIEERKRVASLTATPAASNKDNDKSKKSQVANLPMAQYAEQIIAQEGLK